MAKFRLKLKLTGLEVEIEGERADVPQMATSVAQQVGNLLQPAIAIAAANPQRTIDVGATPANEGGDTGNRNKNGRSRRVANGREPATSVAKGGPLDFTHQPDTWGNPLQSWSPTEKMLWLFYVYEQATTTKEMAVNSIAATFKKHFKEAGAIHPPLVTRELGKAKGLSPALVGEDATKDPPTWYLTAAGKAEAVKLVNAARGPQSNPTLYQT